MKVLIGCEESGVVTNAFRARGHNAYSCDLEHTRGNPMWHMRCDVELAIADHRQWDLIILHPPCTALAVSGNSTYGRGMPKNDQRLRSMEWTLGLWELAKKHSPRVALENPVSVLFTQMKQQGVNVQYIQPWQFGHGETKKTGFALHRLPFLTPTHIVEGREQRVHYMGPSPTRARDRSVTFQGVADAMAEQWGQQ